MSDAFAVADLPESCFAVEGPAGGVFRENPGLNCPVAIDLGARDQFPQELGGDAPACLILVNVHRVLDDAMVGRPG